MTKFIEVVTTTDSIEEARSLIDKILNLKLAACGSIVPIESSYWWEDKVEKTAEFQLTMKTIESNYVEIENLILQNHSYETPQIISIPILGGSREYLDWLVKVTDQKSEQDLY